jgi:simple sugar transport system substrate-binding protein
MRIMADSIRRARPRSWRRHAKVAAAVLAAGAALTACSKSAATTTGAGATTAGNTAAAAGSGGPAVSGGVSLAGKTVLFDIYDPESNTFFQPAVEGATAAAAAFGLKLQIEYANGDDTTAISQIKTAIASGYAGIAAKLPDIGVANTACTAKAAGIPFVSFNTDAATGASAQCVESFVGQSFVSAGQLIAGYMVDKGYIKRGDQVLCPVESPDEEYAVARKQGVEDVLAPLGIQCSELGTGDDLAPAKADMVEYLLGHHSTAAIIALGGTPLAEAPAAIKAVGMTIPIAGFDLSFPQIVTGIQDGSIVASVNQEPYAQGFYAIEELALQIKFGIPPSNIDTSDNALITKANVGSFAPLVPNYQ